MPSYLSAEVNFRRASWLSLKITLYESRALFHSSFRLRPHPEWALLCHASSFVLSFATHNPYPMDNSRKSILPSTTSENARIILTDPRLSLHYPEDVWCRITFFPKNAADSVTAALAVTYLVAGNLAAKKFYNTA